MEKVENEDHEKTVIPSEKHYADFAPAAVPVAPDGGIPPGYGLEQPQPLPAATPENFVCLRGPCRHHWHLVTMAGEGNPAGTWAELGLKAPRQHHYACTANPGMETDLTDDCVFECSRWDPTPPHDLVQLDARRRAYNESAEGRAVLADDQPEEQIDEGDLDGDTDDATEG